MAGSYGSVSRPANLGPFRRIVEVNWSNGRYIRVGFALKLESNSLGESATGPGVPFVEPFSYGFTTVSTPEYQDGTPSVAVWTGGGFVSADDATLAGVPTLPPALTFAAWAVQGINVPADGLYSPFPRWLPASGPSTGIDHPAAAGYLATLSNQWEAVAQPYVSDPLPAPFAGTVPKWATFNPTPVQQDTFGFDVSGLSAVLDEKTYLPVGTRIEGQGEFNTGSLMVLLERQP